MQPPQNPPNPYGTMPTLPGQQPPIPSQDYPTSTYPSTQQPQPEPRASAWQRFNAWLGTKSTGQRTGIGIGAGCSALLVLCVLCSCIGAALGSGGTTSTGNNVGAVTTTRTAGQLQQQATATAIATVIATATATKVPPTPTPAPAPTATPKPKPQPTCIPGAVNCNPWGYNFSHGSYIYNPPYNFCNYFNCIASFWEHTNGYVEECQDSTYSHSGGVRGSCSYHGGNWRALLKP